VKWPYTIKEKKTGGFLGMKVMIWGSEDWGRMADGYRA
jgi:hypothetical protein